jgi:xanthine dehydrogenase accessory factor
MSSGYAADLRSREEELRSGRQPFAVATVVRAMRPTSAKAGDRALVLPDGTIEGFVGGDCAESSVRLHALRVLATAEPVMLRIVPAEELAAAAPEGSGGSPAAATAEEGTVTVANPCASGGMLEIFLEGRFPPPLVQVHGDGPTARALRDVAGALGYEVRPVVPGGQVPPDTAAVIAASHGRDEAAVLTAALAAGVPYVGLVASRKRGSQVLASLDVAGAALSRVRTPAGLDIGARTPQEIALSIFAQIIAERPRPGSRSGQDPAAPARPARPGRYGGPAGAGPAGVAGQAGPAGSPAEGGQAAAPSAPGPATATDPVCGMSVAVAEATLRLPYDGGIWYFCGPGCRQAFAEEPGRYLIGSVNEEPGHGQGSGAAGA